MKKSIIWIALFYSTFCLKKMMVPNHLLNRNITSAAHLSIYLSYLNLLNPTVNALNTLPLEDQGNTELSTNSVVFTKKRSVWLSSLTPVYQGEVLRADFTAHRLISNTILKLWSRKRLRSCSVLLHYDIHLPSSINAVSSTKMCPHVCGSIRPMNILSTYYLE